MKSEQELVTLAREGDEEAFAQLVRENESRIYTLTLRMTNNREDAQDLAQEAFLNAWRGIGKFQGDSSFSTWLYRLASNACIDHLRRRKRRQEVDFTAPLYNEEDQPIELPDSSFDPQFELERQQQRQAVEYALAALPPAQRKILVLRELHGLSYQEIAQALDLDLGTVKSRISRGRLAMRNILRQEGNLSSASSSTPVEMTGKE